MKNTLLYAKIVNTRILRQKLNLILTILISPMVLVLYYIAYPTAFRESVIVLLVFGLILHIFPIALYITQEKENESILIPMQIGYKNSDLIFGIFIPHLFWSFPGIILFLSIAYLLGWEYLDFTKLLFNILGCLSALMAIGIILGSIALNSLMSFLTSSLLMFIMVVFSGLLFPLPEWMGLEILPTVILKKNLSMVSWNGEWKYFLLVFTYWSLGLALFRKMEVGIREKRNR